IHMFRDDLHHSYLSKRQNCHALNTVIYYLYTMASQTLNHSDESVPVDHAAVEDHNHGRLPNHQADTAVTEYREVNVDQLSESDFEEMKDSGLPYGDHDYLGSNPNVKCPPETSQFPVMHGVTDQYLNGETSDPCVERPDNRLTSAAAPIPAPGSTMRKPQVSGGTIFRPVKDFAHSGPSQLSVPGKPVAYKNVTQPKKSGRPPRNDVVGNDRLIGRAMVKAGIQTQHGHHLQPHLHHQQTIQTVQDIGLTVRGAAPLVTPARGQKVMPRGRSAALIRRDLPDVGSGFSLVPAQHHSMSPKKVVQQQGTQFRSAQAAEEAHTREMMEAAQNALAPANVTISGHNVMVTTPTQLHPIVLPVHHQQQSAHNLNDGDLPRTPGKGHSYTPISSPQPGVSRRTISESQEINMQLLQEPLRTNSDGLPVTPGGERKAPGRSGTPRSRMSISESTASGSQTVSPQVALAVSPTRQTLLQHRPLHPTPQRQMMHSGQIKSPSGPSTMASAQMQMSSNAPIPSLHHTYNQQPVIQRHLGPSPPGRVYYDGHGGQAAPLIAATGSNTYTPRRRKEKETDDAVEAEVSRNVKTILQAEKTNRLSTTSSHTLSPRNDASDDESTRWDNKEEQSGQERKEAKMSESKRANHKQSKREAKQLSESEKEEGVDWIISCICGQKEDDGEEMVECDKCNLRWEHVDCIFPRTKKAPEGKYYCHVCNPRPTELTPEQARAYQDRVKEQKERHNAAEIQRKLKERVKRKEENSRKSLPLARPPQSKGNMPKQDKFAPPGFRELEKNEYSHSARRLLSLNRSTGGDLEMFNILRSSPRARSLIVQHGVIGVVSLNVISSGDYIVELTGHVCLQRECSTRDLDPGSLNHFTFLIEKEDEKLIIDARKCGNFARHLRRSCKPNAEMEVIMSGTDLHVMIKAKEEIARMVEITIELDADWRTQPRPTQECACNDQSECAIERHFNKNKMDCVESVASSSRRSLPTSATPKGGSPVRRAATEKKKSLSAKKVIAKKGRKKGAIKLPRHSRKSKGRSNSTGDESEEEDDTEKEYEESTADEKEREEREKSEKSSRRGRRNTGSSWEVKEEEKTVVSKTRSTRSRTDSEVKKEEEEVPTKNEKKKSVDNNESESGKWKKEGRQIGVEKETDVKEEPSSPSTQKVKKVKKPWPKMDYSLPSERNKPTREERKAQAFCERMEKEERKSRGPLSRGRTPATPAVAPKKEKQLSSGRGKRKTETEEEAGRGDRVTADASTPLPPPTKKWAEGKKEETTPTAPSSLSSMHSPLREETVAAVAMSVPSAGKKKLLHRYQQGQKEKEKAAAEEAAKKMTSPSVTPTRGKRGMKKEEKGERGAVEALVDMGGRKGKGGLREEMKRHAVQCRQSMATSAFSLEDVKVKEEEVERRGSGAVSLPSAVTTPMESGKSTKNNLTLEEYKKRRQIGGSASGGMKKEGERKEEPKKSFMPSVDSSASVSTTLPHVNLPGLDETVGLDELQRRLYGDTSKKEGSGVGKTESAPKRLSINERLKNEFALPIRSSAPAPAPAPISVVTSPSRSAVGVASAPSPPSLPTGSQLTPTGGRVHKHRLSDARAMNVDPPGLMNECPPPSTHTPARFSSNSSATPSANSSSFVNRTASFRNAK
ncbi:hypothetical protein PMAYCL1PPCAC_18113, partial [Pristionchus mayeri]